MIKLKVTKKQQRIIDDIMSQLNDRQRQYVKENHDLFPGSSNLPFMFYLSFDRNDRLGTQLLITVCPTYIKADFNISSFNVLFFSEIDGDKISADYFWKCLCQNLENEWVIISQSISDKSKYLPMLQNANQ